MNRYHPIASPDRDLTINGTPIRHIYDADRIWVHNADLAEAIGALAKGSLLIGVSTKWKRKWREDLGGGKATRAVTYLVPRSRTPNPARRSTHHRGTWRRPQGRTNSPYHACQAAGTRR